MTTPIWFAKEHALLRRQHQPWARTCLSHASTIAETQQFVLDGMSWRAYERALRTFDGRRVRINFSRGVLEIRTLPPEHERLKYLLVRMVDVLVEELGGDSANFGSMTFKRRPKGMEPDECFWIAHELDVRGRDTLDPATDPPPDLVIEIEVSRSVVNRLAILAAMRAAEVWRYDGQRLRVLVRTTEGKFHSTAQSLIPVSACAGTRPISERAHDAEQHRHPACVPTLGPRTNRTCLAKGQTCSASGRGRLKETWPF